ncbi:MAG: gp53-like domain-containing protein [Fluviibacter sp.]
MTVSLKHTFQSPNSDGADANLVQPSSWNAEHTLSCATSRLLGRTTAGTGAVEELSVDATLALAAGSLGVTPGTYVTPAGTETLTNKTLTSPTINGGTITGITDLAIADGGTGASTAAAAFANIVVSASDLTSIGYIKLQNGLIFQWGTKTVGTDTSAAVLFATSGIDFPTACWNVQLSWVDSTVGGGILQAASGISTPTKTGFTIYNDGTSRVHHWFAIGN